MEKERKRRGRGETERCTDRGEVEIERIRTEEKRDGEDGGQRDRRGVDREERQGGKREH